MAELRRWAFAAFHTALLVALGVWAIHLGGAVGDLLRGLDTAVGLGIYGLLWGIGWSVTGRALAAAPPASARMRSLVAHGALYGAVTAVAFLLALVLVGGPLLVLRQGLSASALLLVASTGAAAATVVGALIGALFGTVDGLLARTGAALARPTAADEPGN
ncbi:hypothetical protein [Natronomonas marina]|jgi:hypothetical protein|uniref:hypothetical protein n=1 Tax=Natronomonas marina TaxID=2961939 RepID=UPI0020C9840A|nr:hypothetical protein [Natronomonas marina]